MRVAGEILSASKFAVICIEPSSSRRFLDSTLFKEAIRINHAPSRVTNVKPEYALRKYDDFKDIQDTRYATF